MSFVQTGFLLASAAVAIPVLVHLLNRWQVRRVELGTLRFLREVIHDGSQRRKIRRWLLLLTRSALVVALAFLFARPFLPEQTRGDGNRLRVILVDRSASMGMPGKSGRLIDDAVGAAASSAADLGPDATVQWAWFDRHVEPLPESTLRPAAPRAVVGDTNYPAALSWARNLIHAFPASLADVVLVTDLQQSGLASDTITTESFDFPADVPVQIIDVGRAAANNLAIAGLFPSATRLETQQQVVVSATLFNYGTRPFEEVPITVAAFDGTRTVRLKKTVNVPSDQAEEITFDFGELQSGTWQVTMAVDVDDDLAADNRRFTAFEVAEPTMVTVIDSGSREDRTAGESYFLVKALEQGGNRFTEAAGLDAPSPTDRSRFHANVIRLQDSGVPALNLASNPIVVVADAGELAKATVEQLGDYVRGGGRLLVFAGDGDGKPLQRWSAAGLAPGRLQAPEPSGVMPFRIAKVTAGSSMLRPFEDPQHGDLSRLSFRKLQPVALDESTNVLAWFDRGRPAVTEHRVEEGRVVWFLASADASWGNWTTSPLYLPLVQQMVSDLLNLTGEGPIRFRTIGDEIVPERESRQNSQTITTVSMTDDSPVAAATLAFKQLGFQRRGQSLYVVNGAAKESDPTRMQVVAFREHFGLANGAVDAMVSASVMHEQRNELWRWLAAAVFVLLVAEFGLANRTTA